MDKDELDMDFIDNDLFGDIDDSDRNLFNDTPYSNMENECVEEEYIDDFSDEPRQDKPNSSIDDYQEKIRKIREEEEKKKRKEKNEKISQTRRKSFINDTEGAGNSSDATQDNLTSDNTYEQPQDFIFTVNMEDVGVNEYEDSLNNNSQNNAETPEQNDNLKEQDYNENFTDSSDIPSVEFKPVPSEPERNVKETENDTEQKNPESSNDKIDITKYFSYLKKGIIFIVAIMIMVVVPLTLKRIFSLTTSDNSDKDNNKGISVIMEYTSDKYTESHSKKPQKETESSNPVKDNITEKETAKKTEKNYETAIGGAFVTEESTTQSSGRFNTIEELDQYILSTTYSIFTVAQNNTYNYTKETIKGKQAINNFDNYNVGLNEILHLLLINKSVYVNNGYGDVYEARNEYLLKALTYNDTISEMIKNGSSYYDIDTKALELK